MGLKMDCIAFPPNSPKFVKESVVPQFRSLDKQGFPNPYFPELKGVTFLSLDASRRLFEGRSHATEEVFAAAKAVSNRV
jgi:hypothetical protein